MEALPFQLVEIRQEASSTPPFSPRMTALEEGNSKLDNAIPCRILQVATYSSYNHTQLFRYYIIIVKERQRETERHTVKGRKTDGQRV